MASTIGLGNSALSTVEREVPKTGAADRMRAVGSLTLTFSTRERGAKIVLPSLKGVLAMSATRTDGPWMAA